MVLSNLENNKESLTITKNRSNRKYSKEEKEKLIARMCPPESISTSKLSEETRKNILWNKLEKHASIIL